MGVKTNTLAMAEERINETVIDRLNDGARFVAVVMRTDVECLFGVGGTSWQALCDAMGKLDASEFVDQVEWTEYRHDGDTRSDKCAGHDGWEDRVLIFKR